MDFKQKFEPKGNKIIHGVGQANEEDYKEYCKTIKPLKPIIWMVYDHLNKLHSFESIQKFVDKYSPPALQLGLSMVDKTGDCKTHYEYEVAEGKHDENIKKFCEFIKKLGMPVFVRLGYEFNLLYHNGYQPDSFIKAWKRFHKIMKETKTDNMALVWHWALWDGPGKDFAEYYPGDKYVDWIGLSLFDIGQIYNFKMSKFMDFAKKHKKPVMICESTAKYFTTKNKSSWDNWFKHYFEFIKKYPIIKCFCYINCDWKERMKNFFPRWAAWGECRISKNKIIKRNYIKEIKKSKYLNNLSKKEFLKEIYK